MSHFLTQVSYTSDAWSALVKNPVNRMDQIRPAVEKLGGKIVSGYMAFGDYDLVRSIKTTPLLTSAEAMEALKKAQGSGYRAVGSGS